MNIHKIVCDSFVKKLAMFFMLANFILSPFSVVFAQTAEIPVSPVAIDSSTVSPSDSVDLPNVTDATPPLVTENPVVEPVEVDAGKSSTVPSFTTELGKYASTIYTNTNADKFSKNADSMESENIDSSVMSTMSLSSGTPAPSTLSQTPGPKVIIPTADSSTGALSYQYPIPLPPGRNGMTPELSLIYNSQKNDINSIIGYNFELNIPYIVRKNTYGIEQLYSRNDYTSSVDGDLVLLSTVGTTMTFSPESQNSQFNKYVLDTSTNTWKITFKNGTYYVLGSSTSSRQDDSNNLAHIYKWMLSSVVDTNGNDISYTYFKDSGQIYPNTITYTNNGASTGIYEVDFLRQARTDYVKSYQSGFLSLNNFIVNQIDVKTSGNITGKYVLAYTAGDNGNRLDLSSITQSGTTEDGSSTITLPATTFASTNNTGRSNWTSSSWALPPDFGVNGQSLWGDLNGDGFPDMLTSYTGANGSFTKSAYINNRNGTWTSSSQYIPPVSFAKLDYPTSNAGYRLQDLNGDGLADLFNAQVNCNGANCVLDSYIYMNTGSGWNLITQIIPVPLTFVLGGPVGTMADFNGDGLPDVVLNGNYNFQGSNYFPYKVYLNNGDFTFRDVTSTWTDLQNFGPENIGNSYADVNGDGIADVTRITYTGNNLYPTPTAQVFIGNGIGQYTQDTDYDTSMAFSYYSGSYPTDLGVRLADINGDGLPDLLRNSSATPLPGHGPENPTYINTGHGFALNTGWSLPISLADNFSPTSQFVDLNADGLPDIFGYDTGTIYLNNGIKPDALSQITNPQGAATNVTYNSSVYDPGTGTVSAIVPFSIQTVKTISTTDPVNNITNTDSYTYADGLYYYDSSNIYTRKFAGFGTISKTDLNGNTNTTYYHQGNTSNTSQGEYQDDYFKIGKPYRIEQTNSSGALYGVSINKWDEYSLGTGSVFVKLARTTALTYDGTGSHKDTAQEYIYDNTYGNVTSKTDWGQVTASTDGSFTDTGSDKSVESISYVANTGNYVVGLPYDDSTVDQSSVKVNQTRTYYDGNSLGTTGNGNPTKVESWVTGSTYVNTQKTYNSTYGTVATSTDPDGNVTTYTLDSYHLYPATITDALTYDTLYTYDYSSGQIKQKTDPNGFVYKNIYDGMDRVIEQDIPGASTPYTPVAKTTYAYTDTSGSVAVHKVDYLDGSINVDTYSYFDGLGRLIQKRKESDTYGYFNTSDIAYNSFGLIQKESLPYLSSGSSKTSPSTTTALYVNYTYDPLKRLSTRIDAVGTTSYEYNLWKTSVTDPRGKVKDLYSDARGNLIQVDEHNSGSTYSTYYTYNLNGKLLSITDALSNLRNFTYDGLGNRLTAQDLHALGDTTYGSWSYSYDNAGNMTQSISPESKTVNYTYDDLNRKLTENYTGAGGTEITYAYDSCINGIGHLCSVTMTSGANTAYTYDSNGNVASEAKIINSTTYNTSYTYDRQGNQLIITYPDSAQVRYTFNTAGSLNQIERKESGGSFTNVVSNIDYSPMDQATLINNANGVNTTNTYDANNLYRLSNKTSINTNASSSNNNPVITLTGATLVNKSVGDTWTDPGYSATDVEDGDLTSSVILIGSVNTTVAGTYQIIYSVVDSQSAPAASMIRTVVVKPAVNLTVQALVVGGGGGGGSGTTLNYGASGAGGGAGGYQYDANHSVIAQAYNIVVGDGGASNTSGGNSSFDTITANGGGYGGNHGSPGQTGDNGGSGGGGGGDSSNGVIRGGGSGGTGSQGNNGGSGSNMGRFLTTAGGGGGGAGSPGTNGVSGRGGATQGVGGSGIANSISGTSITYAQGGNAGGSVSGNANTGNGGDGGYNASGYAGGSGIVIISYPTSGGMTATGGTITTSGSNTINTFTSNGTFTVSTSSNNNPVITLTGSNLINLNIGDTWTEPGYSATDTEDGNLTSGVTVTGSVNTSVAGTYQIIYSVVDSQSSPAARMIRTIVVRTVGGSILQNSSYTYDANGNITQIVDASNTSASKTVTYTYDDLNRMTQAVATNVASGQSTYTQNFTYNAIGNITAGPVGSYTYAGTGYANPHAATSINSVTNTYDHDGNVLTDGTLTNTWNYKDQLATSTNGTFARTYKYGQDGNRVSSDDGTIVTVYPNKYYTYDGTTKTKDIYAGDILVATITTVGSTVTPYYVHTDHLGSTNVTSDGSGAQVDLYDYFPYGNTRISTGSPSNQRQFLGQKFDSDTSYSYLQARYLRSSIGQFISEDPQFWKFDNSWLQDPQNQNSYSYGRDNPITNKDPSGRGPEMAIPIAAAAGYTVGFLYEYGSDIYSHLRSGDSFSNSVFPSSDRVASYTDAGLKVALVSGGTAATILAAPGTILDFGASAVAKYALTVGTGYTLATSYDLSKSLVTNKPGSPSNVDTSGNIISSVVSPLIPGFKDTGRYPLFENILSSIHFGNAVGKEASSDIVSGIINNVVSNTSNNLSGNSATSGVSNSKSKIIKK